MDKTQLLTYFPFLAVFGILATFWTQTKNFLLRLFRIFWKKRRLPNYDISLAFYKAMLKESKVINFDDYNIKCETLFDINQKMYLPICFKNYKMEIFLYKNFIPVFIFAEQGDTISVQYLKFTFNFERILKKAVDITHEVWTKGYAEKKSFGSFYIREFKGKSLKSFKNIKNSSEPAQLSTQGNPSFASEPNSCSTINNYQSFLLNLNREIGINKNNFSWYCPNNLPQDKYQFTEQGLIALNSVEKWLRSEKWYQERNIPFRRGCILYGKCGTGKSSLVVEIAKKLKIPILVFQLSTMDDSELGSIIEDMTNDPAIILFEDIDIIWDGRKNLTASTEYGGVTFDFFINKLSGVQGIKNKYIFLTTNHLNKLDEALLRDGRVDEKIELSSINMEQKFKLASVILSECPENIEIVLKDGVNDSTAEFENRCVRIALDCLWNK